VFCIDDAKLSQGRSYALSKVNETLHALDLNKGHVGEGGGTGMQESLYRRRGRGWRARALGASRLQELPAAS
jgi:hypothetical protein